MLGDIKRQYKEAIQQQKQVSLYALPWWLDATCGPDGWEILVLTDQAGKNIAFLPYHTTFIRRLRTVTNPPMTQWLPLLIKENNTGLRLENLIQNLPRFSILDISLKNGSQQVSTSDHLKINMRYSYIISRNQNIDDVKSKYNEGLRRNLRDAEKKYSISVTNDVDTFVQLCKSTYAQRKTTPPHWLESVVPVVHSAIHHHNRGLLEFAYYNGKPIAGIMTGWDELDTYYFIGGRTADDGGASAHALLLDNAIRRSCEQNRSFDFEGSMHPGIANFFQSFGAKPEPYWRIRKFNGMGKFWAMFQP